jgi:hypothetical protein
LLPSPRVEKISPDLDKIMIIDYDVYVVLTIQKEAFLPLKNKRRKENEEKNDGSNDGDGFRGFSNSDDSYGWRAFA